MDRQEKNYIFGIRAIIEAIVAGKTIDKLLFKRGSIMILLQNYGN